MGGLKPSPYRGEADIIRKAKPAELVEMTPNRPSNFQDASAGPAGFHSDLDYHPAAQQ
jgi:hypothetical protein